MREKWDSHSKMMKEAESEREKTRRCYATGIQDGQGHKPGNEDSLCLLENILLKAPETNSPADTVILICKSMFGHSDLWHCKKLNLCCIHHL